VRYAIDSAMPQSSRDGAIDAYLPIDVKIADRCEKFANAPAPERRLRGRASTGSPSLRPSRRRY